ncbi:MAG: hypothetical protein ACE5K8_04305 [Candidatus Zixiibacteriota bacterium]
MIASLAIVCYPRFDRQDIGPITNFVGKKNGKPSLGDSPNYMKYVDFFRGKEPIAEVHLPFRYRPLAPLLASLLPVENPMTALNVINLLCLYLALFFLFYFLKNLGFSYWYALTGCFMFSVSFPTFYYGVIGLVDPVLICLCVAGSYFIFKQRWLAFTFVLLLGTLAKEIIVLLIPVAVAFFWKTGRPWKVKLAVFLLVYVVPTFLLRYLFRQDSYYHWIPSADMLASNIRLRALLSVILTLGLQGFVSMGFVWHYQKLKQAADEKFVIPLFVGVVVTVLLLFFSMLTAYTDGRFVWPMTVYCIPLSLWVIREWSRVRTQSVNL